MRTLYPIILYIVLILALTACTPAENVPTMPTEPAAVVPRTESQPMNDETIASDEGVGNADISATDITTDTTTVVEQTPSLQATETISVASVISPAVAVDISSILPEPPAEMATNQIPVYGYEILNTYPHDPSAFTQGLIWEDGVLYEGTGLRGRSTVRKVELETGAVVKGIRIPDQYFGEGITIFGERLIELTWQSRVGFVFDKNSFEFLQEFQYPTEGWGITHDGERLIMSDGSATLFFWDPETLAEIGRVDVSDNGNPVVRINELEYIDGLIFANIWQTDRVAVIDPENGKVVAWIDFTGLLSDEDRANPVDVLNGIAFDRENRRLFVTGKLWPKLFEVMIVSRQN